MKVNQKLLSSCGTYYVALATGKVFRSILLKCMAIVLAGAGIKAALHVFSS